MPWSSVTKAVASSFFVRPTLTCAPGTGWPVDRLVTHTRLPNLLILAVTPRSVTDTSCSRSGVALAGVPTARSADPVPVGARSASTSIHRTIRVFAVGRVSQRKR